MSAVASADPEADEPFSAATRSGQLIREIEADLGAVECYYTNLVKCLPLTDGKLRYPTRKELEACFSNFELELKKLSPEKVVLFGKQVSDFVAGQLGLTFSKRGAGHFEFGTAHVGGIDYLSASHPSYVLIYKRRHLDQYRQGIGTFIASR